MNYKLFPVQQGQQLSLELAPFTCTAEIAYLKKSLLNKAIDLLVNDNNFLKYSWEVGDPVVEYSECEKYVVSVKIFLKQIEMTLPIKETAEA